MPKKITFIGAGSLVFTRNLIRDLLTFPAFQDATIALMDIDDERLKFAEDVAHKIVSAGNYPAKIIATKNRAQALEGANGVVF
ncbi:MAG: alpha-glucosidase/alpha-galactosidase, partial [Candidatus Parvarchaeota archaeon]